MASEDWAELDNVLAVGIVARGATAGLTPPAGGGTFVYGYNCLDGTAIGAVGSYALLGGFSPMASGGSVRACLQRVPGTATEGFSPLLFLCAAGHDVNDTAYLLGLEDHEPYRIVLRKGTIIGGIPQAEAGEYLRRSSAQYQIADDQWHHLRLDAVVEPTGDVVLQVFENDLAAHPLGGAPSWTAIGGMAQFVDDALGINSGSAPYTSGYAGFACAHQEQVGGRAAVDHVQVLRQV